MWSTPLHASGSDWTSAIVVASRKSSSRRREVEVVGIRDGYPRSLSTGHRIDGRQDVPAVVRDPERRQVIRGNDVLRQVAGRKRTDYPVAAGVDDRHAAVVGIGDIDERPGPRRDA